jgi:CYTH domain-containing protein
MYKKEIERKFLVNKGSLPNLSQFEYANVKQGYLSQEHDSLTVRVRSFTGSFKEGQMELYYLDMKDSGLMSRNELTYGITKEEFETSYQLCGDKVITKKRYYIPSEKNEGKMLEVDVYDDFDFVTCEFEGDSVLEVESLIWEDWFTEELTYKGEFSNRSLAFKKAYGNK